MTPAPAHRPAAMIAALCCTLTAAAANPDDAFVRRGERAWADVAALADDAMEGRRAGTPGHRRAAEYVARAFADAGLKPGGDGGWFQSVNLISRTIREEQSSASLIGAGQTVSLTPGKEFTFSLRGNFAREVEAPLVFVGHGLRLPQFGVDDLAGLDLNGKVVVAFSAAPKAVPSAAGAHFDSSIERWKTYRDAGAVGMVMIPNPFSMDVPWERATKRRLEPVMALGPPEEDLYAGQKVVLTFNPEHLATLFQGAPESVDTVLAALEDGATMPHFDLPWKLRAVIEADVSNAESHNVIGILRGSDRRLRPQRVVLTAHLDHLGVGGDGEDRIFNGAMDNASGVAVLIDIARRMRESKARPRRTLVFAAVTAEESGLLGSRAFVSRAQREQWDLVANVNMDMFLPLFPLRQLTVFGLDESDLAADVRAVADAAGVTVQPDPQPARNRFIRSDQYSFVRAGIPALALKTGFDADTPEAALEKEWTSKRYHSPADDLSQPVDLGSMGRFANLLELLSLRVANRPDTPAWNATSTFNRPRASVGKQAAK